MSIASLLCFTDVIIIMIIVIIMMIIIINNNNNIINNIWTSCVSPQLRLSESHPQQDRASHLSPAGRPRQPGAPPAGLLLTWP